MAKNGVTYPDDEASESACMAVVRTKEDVHSRKEASRKLGTVKRNLADKRHFLERGLRRRSNSNKRNLVTGKTPRPKKCDQDLARAARLSTGTNFPSQARHREAARLTKLEALVSEESSRSALLIAGVEPNPGPQINTYDWVNHRSLHNRREPEFEVDFDLNGEFTYRWGLNQMFSVIVCLLYPGEMPADNGNVVFLVRESGNTILSRTLPLQTALNAMITFHNTQPLTRAQINTILRMAGIEPNPGPIKNFGDRILAALQYLGTVTQYYEGDELAQLAKWRDEVILSKRFDCSKCGAVTHNSNMCCFNLFHDIVSKFLEHTISTANPRTVVQVICGRMCFAPEVSGEMHNGHCLPPPAMLEPIDKSEFAYFCNTLCGKYFSKELSDMIAGTYPTPSKPSLDQEKGKEKVAAASAETQPEPKDPEPPKIVDDDPSGDDSDSEGQKPKKKTKKLPILYGKVLTDSEASLLVSDILIGDPRNLSRKLKVVHVEHDMRPLAQRNVDVCPQPFQIEEIEYVGIKQIFHSLGIFALLLQYCRLNGTWWGLLRLAWLVFKFYPLVYAIALITSFWVIHPLYVIWTLVVANVGIASVVSLLAKSPVIWEKQKLTYIPHLLTNVFEINSTDPSEQVIAQQLMRISALNVPDIQHVEWTAGTRYACQAVLRLKRVFPSATGCGATAAGLYKVIIEDWHPHYTDVSSPPSTGSLAALSEDCWEKLASAPPLPKSMHSDTEAARYASLSYLNRKGMTLLRSLQQRVSALKTNAVSHLDTLAATHLLAETETTLKLSDKDSIKGSLGSPPTSGTSTEKPQGGCLILPDDKPEECPSAPTQQSTNSLSPSTSQKPANNNTVTPTPIRVTVVHAQPQPTKSKDS